MTASTWISTLLLTAAVILPSAANDKDDEQKKLDALKSRIQSLQQTLQSHTRERDKQSTALRKTEVAAGKLRKKIHATEAELKSLKTELTRLNQQKVTLEASRHAQQKLIGQHINTAYRLGKEEHIKLLLNEENPSRFNRMLKYHDYFLKARAEKVEAYLETINTISDVEQSIGQKEQQLIAQRNNLTAQQNDLKAQVAERKVALTEVRKLITSDQQQLNKLNSERKALEAIMAALEQAVADLPTPSSAQPFIKRQGKMSWPVSGYLQKRFGNRRKADIRWDGWLLSAKAGSPVNAIHNGRVVFSDYLRGHGLLLIIDHGDGYMSLYAHNQVLLKETGDWVRAGELISRVGDSGGLDQSALYFEIRKDGKPRNPSKWLKKR